MNLLLSPLRPDDQGPAVANLHDALEALGSPVAAAERDQFRLGRATQQVLQAFQKREGLDTTGEVDAATATRLNQLLDEAGQLSYRVSGRVLNARQRPQPGQRVAAYDVDLRGAGRYQTAQTEGDLKQLDGLELLGEARTDADGAYQIGFSYRQYGQAERGRADVVAFVFDADGRVLGASRLGLAADYTHLGELPGLDVLLTVAAPAGPSEYERLSTATDPLLRESKLAWPDLAEGANDQLAFLAQETEQLADRLAVRVSAAHRAQEAARVRVADPTLLGAGGWQLSEELLYGLGRQRLALQWATLAVTAAHDVLAALQQAANRRIIGPLAADAAKDFATQLGEAASALTLQPPKGSAEPAPGELTLTKILGFSLPKATQQTAFLAAHRSFRGSAAEFWDYLPTLPEFKDNAKAIQALQLTTQLTVLTGGYQPLVEALQVGRGIQSPQQLLDLSATDWGEVLKQTGLPADVADAETYTTTLTQLLNAAYPTARIGQLVRDEALPFDNPAVGREVQAFLEKAPTFDIAASRLDDFTDVLSTVADGQAAQVKNELLTVQRLFQVSPSPEALVGLKSLGFSSAHGIAQVPGQTFVQQYAAGLGGSAAAQAVHDRATNQATRLEYAALALHDTLYGATPSAVLGAATSAAVTATIAQHLPNYTDLFKSADACECDECQSVYSPAAYLVDVLRYLDRSGPNEATPAQRPLDVLLARRPDLAYLPLTCENTNTIIPYLDLVNEVLEYYVAYGQLAAGAAHDVAGATAAELRATPQYTEPEAYRKLAEEAAYPFSLPYHQPLDTLRTYAAHLGTSRVALLDAFHPVTADATTRQALAAETLDLTEREHILLTGSDFSGAAAAVAPHLSYGYATPAELLARAGQVPELLARTGLTYSDLVGVLKTRFLNPGQDALDYLGRLFDAGTVPPVALYGQLQQVVAGTLDPATDAPLQAVLAAHGLTAGGFATWTKANLAAVQQVVTLYEPTSQCDLTTTTLRTLRSVVENLAESGLTSDWLGQLHRFVRLWRGLQKVLPKGATIAETDALLLALGEADVTPALLTKLADVRQLTEALKLPISQLAAFWGYLDTSGPKSLYAQLFLNKAVQQLDASFRPDALGRYLTDATQTLAAHQPALLAALRLTADELGRIATAAGLTLATAPLTLANVSQLYRYGALAKALKLPVADLCTLLELLGPAPFSTWQASPPEFVNVHPDQTRRFVAVVRQVQTAKFKVPALRYVLTGQDDGRSTQGLPLARIYQALHDVRAALTQVETNYPALDPAALEGDAPEALRARLLLVSPPEVAEQLLGLLSGTVRYAAVAESNLALNLPAALPALADKVRYTQATGRLQVQGVLTAAERAALDALPEATAPWHAAVAALFQKPEQLLRNELAGIFGTGLDEAVRDLLERPTAPAVLLTPLQKHQRVADAVLIFLKKQLRAAAVVQHVAALLGLDELTTAVLLGAQAEALATEWAGAGLSAAYYKDPDFAQLGLARTDSQVNFDWAAAPDPLLPTGGFSVRWQGYLANDATTTYTFTADVAQAGEALRLWLDDQLVLDKPAADPRLSWETEQTLVAGRFYKIRLDYVGQSAKAGAHLSWRTEQTGKTVVPAANLYPAAVAEAFAQRLARLRRAALLITGFGLTATEATYFQNHASDFAGFDLGALTAEHWQRVAAYTALRTACAPGAEVSLLDVFGAAASTSPPPADPAPLVAALAAATGWEMPVLGPAGPAWPILTALVGQLGLSAADFKNEIRLTQLYAAVQLTWQTGAGVADLADWARVTSDFDALNQLAQRIKHATKARYPDEDWLSVGGGLSDTLRQNQRTALVAYLLAQPQLQTWGARDADGLYEYFLIDVQMGACMDTSRVKQAISSAQLFVARALLNLESRPDAKGRQVGVAPDYFDTNRWNWMKQLPVWQANRKLLVELESYLEPEWRDDKSEFFSELEGELLQNDITDTTAETALRNYVSKLAAVANLRVSGLYEDPDTQTLHVFARAQSSTACYYRTRDKYQHWSAWSKVPVDIRNVASDTKGGEHSGVHLIPVVWKKRLFLFWPEFVLKQEPSSSQQDKSIKDCAEETTTSLAPEQYWELHLAWSELKTGKWTPKTLTEEFVKLDKVSSAYQPVWVYNFQTSIDTQQWLRIVATMPTFGPTIGGQLGGFRLTDIQSKVTILPAEYQAGLNEAMPAYWHSFMGFELKAPLQLKGNSYLAATRDHRLLYSSQLTSFEQLRHPFFYWDDERTFFVTPETITYLIEGVKTPGILPYLPLDKPKEINMIPMLPPRRPLGPDDRLPNPVDWATDFGDLVAATTRPGRDGLPSKSATSLPSNSLLGLDQAGLGLRKDLATRELHLAAEAAVETTAVGDAPAELRGQPLAAPLASRSQASFAAVTLLGGGAVNPVALTTRSLAYVPVSQTAQVVGGAFAGGYGVAGGLAGWKQPSLKTPFRTDQSLRFRAFYHPFASRFETYLNEGGLAGLMMADTNLPDDGGILFKQQYQPNTYRNYVQQPFPRQNVDFDEYGAYSLYNYELFFHAPLFLATRLSKNGQYAEALRWFHFIFDPTTNAKPDPANPNARYWQVKPFKTAPTDSIEDFFRSLAPGAAVENPLIAEWRDLPFRPHRLAKSRPVAYMKNVVIKYVDNLVAWGDSLFRQDSIESINEATQLYVLAGHVLGPKPQRLPRRGIVQAETFASLKPRLDDFSNALVQLENLFPFSSAIPAPSTPYPGGLLGMGSTLYFGIPLNQKMLQTWDTVADRLFKIRHCQNIDGVERKLALFEPPIDPGLLAAALAQGLSLGAVLSDLSTPGPLYRFAYLVQRANEFCSEVKLLGSSILQTIEKRDAEQLARQHAAAATRLLGLVREVKARAVLEATAQLHALRKERTAIVQRLVYYTDLLGVHAQAVPAEPTLAATLHETSALPAETLLPALVADVEAGLADGGATGVKIIAKERDELVSLAMARDNQMDVSALEAIGAEMSMIPTFSVEGQPFGVGGSTSFGGSNLAAAVSYGARVMQIAGFGFTYDATKAGKMAAYIRRDQEWTQLANQATREIPGLDRRLTAAAIRTQMAEKELAAHDRQVLDAQEMELWLQSKYTNQELYQWLKERLFDLYKQTYQLAYNLAKKAEKAYRFELGQPDSSFIRFGYWDSAHDGLLAGEQLSLALRQLESAYLEENRREFELTKHVSLVQLDPAALLQLRQTGACTIRLPEELFDLDYPGHYFRRLKSVSVSVPCVAGPFTTINCTLRLLRNSVRTTTADGDDGYPRNHDEDQLLDDERFVEQLVPAKAVATSSAQFDSGVFELSFRDERYLPFEGAGAISEWKLELGGKHRLGAAVVDMAQFDYNTITDLLLHLRYTAREDAGLFCQKAVQHLQDALAQPGGQLPQRRLFSLKQEFPTEWHRFLHPDVGQPQQLTLDLRGRFPYLTAGHTLQVSGVELVAATTGSTLNSLTLTIQPAEDATPAVEFTGLTLVPHALYNGWLRTVLDFSGTDQPLAAAWQLHYVPAGPAALVAPADLFVLVTYHL
jgi:hypothetical protein